MRARFIRDNNEHVRRLVDMENLLQVGLMELAPVECTFLRARQCTAKPI
jgi:hypothetical protein